MNQVHSRKASAIAAALSALSVPALALGAIASPDHNLALPKSPNASLAVPLTNISWNVQAGQIVDIGPNMESLLSFYYGRRKFQGVDCEKTFGTDASTVYSLMCGMSRRMIAVDMDHVPGTAPAVLAKKIQTAASTYINALGPIDNNLKCFLNAQAYCDWLRTHIKFDEAINEGKYSGEERLQRFDNTFVYDMSAPASACGFYAWNAAYLSSLAGFDKIRKVEGTIQWAPNKSEKIHAWDVITLPDGTTCFSDPTQSSIGLEEARKRNGMITNPYSLPIEDKSQGFFLATHYCMTRIEMVKQRDGNFSSNTITLQSDPYIGIPVTAWDLHGNTSFDNLRKIFESDKHSSATVWTR